MQFRVSPSLSSHLLSRCLRLCGRHLGLDRLRAVLWCTTHPAVGRDGDTTEPKLRIEEHTVLRLVDLGEHLRRPLPGLAGALGTEALLVVHRPEHLVPSLDEETCVVGRSQHGLGVVAVVLEGRVENGVVRIQPFELVSKVEVDAVDVEEHGVGEEQDVHVDRHYHREEHEWRCATELVHMTVGDDGERGGVEENVVFSVVLPEAREHMTHAVVVEFKEVTREDDEKELCHTVPHWVAIQAAVGVGVAVGGEVETHGGNEGGRAHPFHCLKNLIPHFLGRGVLGIYLSQPFVVRGVPVCVCVCGGA